MKKRGRPKISITERYRIQIEVMAGLGLKLDNIASVLDVSPSTLDKWLADPEIKMLYKRGRVKAEIQIAATLFEKAKGGCISSIVWYEKTRCGRSDRAEVKQTGAASPIQIFLPDNGRSN